VFFFSVEVYIKMADPHQKSALRADYESLAKIHSKVNFFILSEFLWHQLSSKTTHDDF